jgi:putative lipoprotein (rSAM/lipoprotein system)
MPVSTYKVTGTVRASDDSSAVQGISLSIRNATSPYPQGKDTTSSIGAYGIEFYGSPERNWVIEVRDTDLTANGSFTSKDTLIEISDNELNGSQDTLNQGEIAKKVDIYIDRITH